MPREQVLYNILKLNSKFICEHNLNIEKYSLKQASLDNALVSVGDCIAFDVLRQLKGDNRSYKEIFNYVQFLRNSLRKAKKEGRKEAARIFNQSLLNVLYMQDFISVENQTKSEYRRVATNGFYVNGIKYVRFSASAGQIRHNTVLFVNEKYFAPLYKTLMCGLDEKIKEINLAKLSAYFSLSTSSILWVSSPRVCVIKDFDTIIPKQKIDWITTNSEGKKKIEERVVDVTLNSADGQGLIDPGIAQKWSNEMGLGYTASSYVVRSVFIKGNLVPFDFKEYARQVGITTIYDCYGYSHKIEDIDCLISQSQFKMWKYYSSWDEYLSYANKGNIKWGVARYNKAEDPEYSLTNYQYIQIMNIDAQDIKELISPTINWIKNICSGDLTYALLYCFGALDDGDEIEYNDIYSRAQNLAMKAVVKNNDFLKDTYVQRKIYRSIIEAINRAKLGKIWMRGNYQFMISDPIAQCRSALGLSRDGEIPADCVYNKFWIDRNRRNENVVLLRSPCLDKHEANVCRVYSSSEAERWYKWIKSGMIYSIYDTSVLRHSDSDFDGDIVFSTDDPTFLKGSQKSTTNPITYDKQSVPSQRICPRNFIETDIRGFGTKVGTYSNYSTIIEAMLPMFSGDNQSRQREELLDRKKLLREINGQEIDRIKGVDAKGPPKDEWLKYVDIDENDDDAVKAEKYYHNSLVIAKKPYFFRYLYPELNIKYKTYEKAYNDKAKVSFGIKMKKLLVKENRTPEENALVRKYHKFSPLINTNCTMNMLCREIEAVDFDIRWNKENVSLLPYYDLNKFSFNPEILQQFRFMYQKWSNKKSLSFIKDYFPEENQEYRDVKFGIIDGIRFELQEEYDKLGLTPMEGLTYIKALSQSYVKFSWGFAWDLLGSLILDCIESDETTLLSSSKDGLEYLGKHYTINKIRVPKGDKKDEESI